MNYNLLEEMGIGSFDLTYLFIAAYAFILVLLIVVIVQPQGYPVSLQEV